MGYIILLPEQRQQNPTPFHNAILADNPTVYFRMDDAATPLTDEMSCSNATTTTGSPAFQQPGKFGTSIESFVNAGPGDYISGAACAFPDQVNSYEIILKRNGVPSTDEYFVGNYQNINLGVESGTGHLFCLFERSTGGGPLQVITTTLDVCDNQWHHVVVTNFTTNWQFYVDGVNQAPATGLNPPNTSTSGPAITLFTYNNKFAAGAPSENEMFIGNISMFAWWRGTALSAPQVAAHYAAYQLI